MSVTDVAQLIQAGGAMVILGLLVWYVPYLAREAFESRRQTLAHQATEREAERHARHEDRNAMQASLGSLLEFFHDRSEAQLAHFDKRHQELLTAVREQTSILTTALHEVRAAVVKTNGKH